MPKGKPWTAEHDSRLSELVVEMGPEPEVGKTAYWAAVAAALPGPERTGSAAQFRATLLGERDKVEKGLLP